MPTLVWYALAIIAIAAIPFVFSWIGERVFGRKPMDDEEGR